MLRRSRADYADSNSVSWNRATRAKWRRQCFQYHSIFGWWHIPNMDARLMLGGTFHRFITNAIGMRDHRDFSVNKNEKMTRLIALGDSYTAGDGVSNDQRMTSLLEKSLPGLEILNFGLNGSGTDQQFLIYENMASEYEADGYIWFFCIENIARNMYSCFPSFNWNENTEVFRPKPFFRLTKDGLTLRNMPVPRITRPANDLGDWTYRFPYLKDHPNDPYAIYNTPDSEHWILMKKIIETFLAKVAPKPVFLVPLPMYQHYLGEAPAGYLDRFSELNRPREHVHLIDLLPALQSVHPSQRSLLRFPDDPHYTSFAHRRAAEALEYSLRWAEPELFATPSTGNI